MNIFKISFTSLLLFLSIFGNSQNIAKYLDDGSNRTSRNILSVGFDPFNGELPVKFERKLTMNLACVVTASALVIEKQNWFDDDSPIKPDGIGYSASIRVKYYYNEFPERMYFSLYPQINVMDGIVFTDVIGSLGYQRVILRKIVISGDVGFGFRFFKDPRYSNYEMEVQSTIIPHFPVTVNVGYLF